jgi:hypothetical protein
VADMNLGKTISMRRSVGSQKELIHQADAEVLSKSSSATACWHSTTLSSLPTNFREQGHSLKDRLGVRPALKPPRSRTIPAHRKASRNPHGSDPRRGLSAAYKPLHSLHGS